MLLALRKDNVTVAQKELAQPSDFRRVAGTSTLVYRGEHYSFTGINESVVIFEHVRLPVIVDGFVIPV